VMLLTCLPYLVWFYDFHKHVFLTWYDFIISINMSSLPGMILSFP
jgi:hypothetical protein